MMPTTSIREKCHINTNRDTDTFVGISCRDGDIRISFPIGFQISDDDKSLRKEIVLLINSIASTVAHKESHLLEEQSSYNDTGFPIQSYMFLLSDFYSHGYYKEREIHYQVSNRGKVDWHRTIRTQKPYVNDNEVFYLGLVTRKNPIAENELITQIHEYCVYESFQKVGWLFSAEAPRKPRIPLNIPLFRKIVKEKLLNTYNNHHKLVFLNMLAVIDVLQSSDAPINYRYGTNRFEYVWEAMIDKVFGIKGKAKYFPKTYWSVNGKLSENASLEPDSIMLYGENVYVLDAKYYKYGITRRPWDLPESTSINKQITYGEYIAEQDLFKKIHGKHFRVYNAFIMPFDSKSWQLENNYLSIGEAISGWKSNSKEYERIQGILLDIKHLMKLNSLGGIDERDQMAACIMECFDYE